ncbi:uncharacterized protein LOC6644630 [Drosophila willistoni]|nr:uncharacterized protein LOC6644630 [Drosophila willistoni]
MARVAFLLLTLLIEVFDWSHGVPWRTFNSYTAMMKKSSEMDRLCPKVTAMRNFNLEAMMGCWHVVQYYASTEELPEYACMKSHFGFSTADKHITMNFSFIFAEDPLREKLQGNITWMIPSFENPDPMAPSIETPAHWIHTEHIYKGIYNTYVIDTDYTSWALIMHCAEKEKHPRYLSALLLSRQPTLGENYITYLREKLIPYHIDLSFMFPINQSSCDHLMESSNDDPLAYIVNGRKTEKEMFKVINQA